MREERIPKKMVHTKMEGKRTWGRSTTGKIDHIRNDLEIRGKNWEKIQENRKWENRDAGHHWKRLKDDDDVIFGDLGKGTWAAWSSRKKYIHLSRQALGFPAKDIILNVDNYRFNIIFK